MEAAIHVDDMSYLHHDVEGQQGQDDELVTVKQAAACVVKHHICAGVEQRLQPNLHQPDHCKTKHPGALSCDNSLLFNIEHDAKDEDSEH